MKVLERKFVENLITKANLEKEISIESQEQVVIQKVLDTLPPAMTPAMLGKWCNQKVDRIIAQYPALKEKSDIIRNRVWEEMMWHVNEDRFAKLRQMITDANPEKLSPTWFKENAQAMELMMRRRFRTLDGKVDWDFIIKKLGFADKFEIIEMTSRNIGTAISALKTLLEQEKPDSFNPSWIVNQDKKLYEYFSRNVRNAGGGIDWVSVINALGEPWKEKWEYASSERGLTLDRVVELLRLKLEKLKPDSFNTKWIQKNCPQPLHYLADRKLRTEKGLHWELVIGRLPQEWQEKWRYQEPVVFTLDDAKNRLTEFLEKEQPEIFSPNWIREQNEVFYLLLVRNLRQGKRDIDWDTLIARLDPKWVKKWEPQRAITFNEAAKNLLAFLEHEQPETFNAGWIQNEHENLYKRISWNLRTEENDIDWVTLVSRLPQEWQGRWRVGMRDETKRKMKEVLTKYSFEGATEQLKSLLEKTNPSEFSPTYISEHDLGLYAYFQRNVRDKNNLVDWKRVVRALPVQWRDKFKQIGREFEKAVGELESLLRHANPQTFNPTFVIQRGSGLYAFFQRNVRGANGTIDWLRIIASLPPKWWKRFYLHGKSFEKEVEVRRVSMLIQKITLGGYSQFELSEFVAQCLKISEGYLKYQEITGKRIRDRNHRNEQELRDLAMDCIATLFTLNERNEYVQFRRYFGPYIDSRAKLNDEELLVMLRRMVIKKTKQELSRIFKERDPEGAKISRNIDVAIKGAIDIDIASRGGVKYISFSQFEGDVKSDKPLFPADELVREVLTEVGPSYPVVEIIRKTLDVLSEHVEYRQCVSRNVVARIIREVKVPREVELDKAARKYEVEDEPHDRIDYEQARQTTLIRLQRKVDEYVEQGKLSRELAQIYYNALADIIEDVGSGGRYSSESYFKALRKYLPHLTRDVYVQEHRTILEYLGKLVKKFLRENLTETNN